MPAVTVTMNLSDETKAFVNRQVAEGRGASVEEYLLTLAPA